MSAKSKRASFSPTRVQVKPQKVIGQPSPLPSVLPLPTIDDSRPISHLEEMLAAEAQESTSKKKNTLLYIGACIVLTGIMAVAVIVYAVSIRLTELPKTSGKKTPVVRISPTATPVPEVVRIEVLNGSGIAGAAAEAAGMLKGKGYDIIRTGNSPKIRESRIYVSATLGNVQADVLLSTVRELFGIASSSGNLQDSTASARIIVGRN